MTPYEIRQNYRQAKSKKKQIRILAELNVCTKDEIKRILKEGERGVRMDKATPKFT